MSDIYIIILSMVILILLVLLTSLILKRLVLDINNEVKKKYLFNISKYNEEIKDLKEDAKTDNNNQITLDNNSFSDECKIYISDVHYKSEGILQKAKRIESKFNVDDEAIVKQFLEYRLVNEDNDTYLDLINTKNILSKLNPSILVRNVDKNLILKKVPKRVRIILEPLYCTSNTLKVLKLLDIIEVEIRKYDPKIYVYTGSKLKDYKNLNDRILTKYDSNIYRGVKIYYHNQMYDYSIE